jgi:hypothetical protein
MKGAMAEDSASTSRPPTASMTTITGRSQNFFRTRRNARNSARNRISECPLHGAAGRRVADPPVTRVATLAEFRKPPSDETQQRGQWRQQAEKEEPQDHRAHDLVQNESGMEPEPVQRTENSGTQEGQRTVPDRKEDASPANARNTLSANPNARFDESRTPASSATRSCATSTVRNPPAFDGTTISV